MNAWDAFAASPVGFIGWTLSVGFAIGAALRGVAALVAACRRPGGAP